MPYELCDYLEIDAAEAARQWRAILSREPASRQETFRPIEVVLCFGLFRLLNPRSFGGGNIHKLPPQALALASVFRRTPSSVVNKMLNLSFDRQHGGRAEPEVFLRLSTEPERFLRLYLTILEAARGLGLGEDQVPDYLGAWQGTRLLGQEELGEREVGLALRERQDEPATRQLREWFGDGPTERIVEQRVRLGQHRFASAVLLCFEHRCGFCGFSPEGLGASGLLIASHIKPWAACGSERERLDPTNGIAACPTHDRAFDAGLLTVNGGYRIHRARGLQARLADRVTESFFGAGVLGERLVWGAGQEGPRRVYLEYHREHVFERVG